MKNVVPLSILICIVFWIGGCDQKPVITPTGKTIKVGIIAPFSGPDHSYGKEGLKGLETAMRLQPYLKNGDRIELVVADNRNEQGMALKLLEKLVVEDKVSAVITFSSSGPLLAMAKVAEEYKTPILAAFATHPGITEQNGFISQLVLDDNFQGIVTALFIRDDLMIDKVAVFKNPNSAYSSHLASEFEDKFKSIGGEITDTVLLTEETDALFKVIERVHGSNPELLYLPIDAADIIRIVKEVRGLVWEPIMMGSDGFISAMFAQHKEELDIVDGMLATDFFSDDMPLTPFGKKAKDIYKETEKGVPTTHVALGAEGYALLLDAMNRCSNPADRECINNKIRSTSNFEGIVGNITIGSNGKAQRPLCINSLQNGRSKFVFKVY